MASVIVKSLKFSTVLKGRLSFSTLKSYYSNGRCIVHSYKQTKNFATAAHKFESSEDSVEKSNVAASKIIPKDSHKIDDALYKIDSIVRRNGRTQMKNVIQALSLITSKEMTSSTHALYLIRSCKYAMDEPPSKRIEIVNQVWNTYQELGIEFDVQHYNSLLDVHITNGSDVNPAEMLATMEDSNIKPNKTTYMLIMKKYCQDGNIDGASEILQYMKKEGLSADEKVFNYLIEGHIKNNDFTGVKDMIEVMRSSNLQPTVDTYVAIACGHAALGQKNEMMNYLKQQEVEYSGQSYLKVIDVLATSGNHQYVDEVLSLIQDKQKYEQDFINAAVELIHKDNLEVAYKLMLEAHNPGYNENTIIFIKQLIKGKKPISKIIHFCEDILEKGLNKNIFVIASRICCDSGDLDCAVPIFKKMMENGYYARPSNFWPMFSTMADQNHSKGAWQVLKLMSELGIPADFVTYTDHLFPVLGNLQPKDILRNVKDSGQIVNTAADALFVHYCNVGEIDLADELTQIFPVTVRSRFDTKAFLDRSVNLSKGSLNKYLKVLKHIFLGVDNLAVNSGMLNSDLTVNSAIQGELLTELVLKKANLLESLLFKYEDLKFSEKVLYLCEQEVKKRNPARQIFVKKLREITQQRKITFTKENLTVADENKFLSQLQAQNISCGPFLTKRIFHHIRTKNVDRVSELIALFKELQLNYSPLMFTNLITMYCDAGDIEKAKETVNTLRTEFPTFKLELSRALDYVIHLMKYGKLDEGFEALKYFVEEPYTYTSQEHVLKAVKKLNMTLNDTQDVELLRKIQNVLMPLSQELGSKNVFLESIIIYHIKKNDLSSAVEEFRSVMMKHHLPVSFNKLLKKCILMEDMNTLQKVIDLTINYCGKSFALLHLAVAFIETFNTQKAVRIIESLDGQTDPKELENICMSLSQQNKIVELKTLIYITKSLNNVDRENLYLHALKACAAKQDIVRAKELYANLKQEIVEPKPEIIKFMENLLKKEHKENSEGLAHESPTESFPVSTEATKAFIEYLEAGDTDAALMEIRTLKKGFIRTLPLKTMTDLVDICLQKNCESELSLNTNAMSYIIENVKDVLEPILEKYSKAGDVEKFFKLSALLPDFSLMSIRFNYYFCKAFITSEKYESLLSELEQRIDKKNKLFSKIAFDEILKFPEYEDRIYNLAVKYLHVNYIQPISVVWAHFFSKGNFEKADEILKKHPFQLDKTDIVLKDIKVNENVPLALQYVDFVKNLTVRPRVKERAYGAALELLVNKGMYEEAADLVVESEKLELLLHKYYVKPLITLKNALEKENKPIPFHVPLDEASNSE